MKRLLLVVQAKCVVLAEPVIAAEDMADGVRIARRIDATPNDEHGYNPGIPRRFDNRDDSAWGGQTAKVTLPMNAIVPCYLEMDFRGNFVDVSLQSWGPSTTSHLAGNDNYWLTFRPEVAGIVDKDWRYIDGSATNNTRLFLVQAWMARKPLSGDATPSAPRYGPI